MTCHSEGADLLRASGARPEGSPGAQGREVDGLVPEPGPQAEPAWLDEAQGRIWITFMQVQLRLSYEMNRQLLNDSDLQLGDYHVLSALSAAPGGRLQISALAGYVGWERSRMSHHAQRMARRGLVERVASQSDGRATDIQLTPVGWESITRAAPGHVALVRQLFFDGLPAELHAGLQAALDAIYRTLIAHGTLPAPEQPLGDLPPSARGGAPALRCEAPQGSTRFSAASCRRHRGAVLPAPVPPGSGFTASELEDDPQTICT